MKRTPVDRNYHLDAWRRNQRNDSHWLAQLVNDDWHARMWQTPDVAMCLGRYSYGDAEALEALHVHLHG